MFRLRLGDFRGSFDFAQDDTLGWIQFLLQREALGDSSTPLRYAQNDTSEWMNVL